MTAGIEKVLLSDIDYENDFYKLSKNPPDGKLVTSIRNYGILDPPLLLRDTGSDQSTGNSHMPPHGYLTILFGHNRLRILRDLDYQSVDARVMDRIDPSTFLSYALLKNYRSAIGPIARIKLIAILKYTFNLDDGEIASICRSDLKVPDFFYRSYAVIQSVIGLPAELKDYIDNREIGYKVIKNLLALKRDDLSLLNSWIERINFRVNYFKDIVDFMVDIGKRSGGAGDLSSIDISTIEGRSEGEELVYREVFRIRYPEYSRMIAEADDIVRRMRRVGVDVDFPRYFEGSSITVKVSLEKGGADKLAELLEKIDRREIERLLDLL